jgi:hypothetical protein
MAQCHLMPLTALDSVRSTCPGSWRGPSSGTSLACWHQVVSCSIQRSWICRAHASEASGLEGLTQALLVSLMALHQHISVEL